MIIWQLIQIDPMLVLPWLIALLVGITVHEVGHGLAAYSLGDDTAMRQGRLSFNPLRHLEPIGAVMMLLVGFGWAKPVPVNIGLVRRGQGGKFLVAVAGLLGNLLVIALSALALKYLLLPNLPANNLLVKLAAFLVYINAALFIFNLLPIPPLDGYHAIEYFFARSLGGLAFFLEKYGQMILLAVVFLTNLIGYLIGFFIFFLARLFDLDFFSLIFRY